MTRFGDSPEAADNWRRYLAIERLHGRADH
jgi:hypothetical protein